jgi:phosphoglycolate phosphatase
MPSSLFLTYKHIIWDWNGTLLDDVWLCVDIMNTMLQKRNKPRIDQEQYTELFDFPVKTYYHKVGFDFSQEPFETLAAEYIHTYDRRQLECTLCPHAHEILQVCQHHGITQSILSACHQERLEQIVAAYQIRPFFLRLSGLRDYYATSKVSNGKALLEDVNVSSHEVLLIGDTTHDFDVAQALGVACVLIDGGHHSRRKLESTRTMIKNSLYELLS